MKRILGAILLSLLIAACGSDSPPNQLCTVEDNGDGTATIICPDGTRVTVGPDDDVGLADADVGLDPVPLDMADDVANDDAMAGDPIADPPQDAGRDTGAEVSVEDVEWDRPEDSPLEVLNDTGDIEADSGVEDVADADILDTRTDSDLHDDLGDIEDLVDDEPAEGPPPPPTNVLASDGTESDFVEVTWEVSPRADSYRVYRDDVEIAVVIANTYVDRGAIAYPPTADGLNLSATDGTRSDAVVVTWSEPSVPEGAHHQYKVVAENTWGRSEPTVSDEGYRSGPAVTGYQLQIDTGTWFDVTGLSYEDLSAPAGLLLSAGTADASDGTTWLGVELSLSGVELTPGRGVKYRVRALNSTWAGTPSSTEIGYRAEPTVTLQWSRSTEADGLPHTDVEEATGIEALDSDAPLNGESRAYRCEVTADTGTVRLSNSDSGYRFVREILPGEAREHDRVGQVVSIDGDVAAVSAPNDTIGNGVGAVYVYRFHEDSGWLRETKLYGAEDVTAEHFGSDLSVSGDVVAVGSAPSGSIDERDLGSAYIFRFVDESAWVEQARLTAPTGSVEDCFGCAVAASNNRVIIGSRAEERSEGHSGAAYVYARDGDSAWSVEDLLLPDDVLGESYFGHKVAMGGNVAAVSAHFRDDETVYTRGVVYVFEYDEESGWVQSARLRSDEVDHDNFGGSLSVSQDRLVVSASQDDRNGTDSGVVYVFRRDAVGGWEFDSVVSPSDVSRYHNFGLPVSISGTALITGAYGDDARGMQSGSAYLFQYSMEDGWTQQAKLVDTEGAEADRYGNGVSVSGQWAAVGAPANEERYDDDIGKAFIYWFGE